MNDLLPSKFQLDDSVVTSLYGDSNKAIRGIVVGVIFRAGKIYYEVNTSIGTQVFESEKVTQVGKAPLISVK